MKINLNPKMMFKDTHREKAPLNKTPAHIQNPGIFATPGIFRIALYSERWHIQNIYDEVLIIFTNYIFFRKACHVEINILR